MAKPVIITIDDDPQVVRAVERDLRRRYSREYRVLRADSGVDALDTLRELKGRDDPVALLLSDHRMPRMNGVEFLEEAIELYPEARKVLLTAYADTDAAIRAINEVGLDYYLQKPWDPPEENLYPVLDDLLSDWRASYQPPFEGMRVVGLRFSPESHRIKDFLARNQVPYRWLDAQTEEGQKILGGATTETTEKPGSEEADEPVQDSDNGTRKTSTLPLVVLEDGSRLYEPTNAEVAERIGLSTRAERPFYDLLIVGGGPAGLAAAVYGASEGLETVMIEREAPGGQAGQSSRIENYLGFPAGLSGGDLSRRAVAQARRFGVEIITPQEVSGGRVEDPYRVVTLADGAEISCHALTISTGVSYRKLEAPGVERLAGAGVYYGAAATEALSCWGEDVFIVGGANSAGQAAMYFSGYARSVTVLVRGDSLEKGMSQYLADEIHSVENIRVRLNTSVAEVAGEDNLESVTLKDSITGETETFPAAGLFIFIGASPRTEWLSGVVERDEKGFIVTGPDLLQNGRRPEGWTADRDPYLLETSVPGIFAAGDVRRDSVKRVASGVGEGSVAIQFVHRYLREV